ncbi:MAG: hypothetical protein MUF23_16425, partial [Pirellula sp.]|nr:hypothetical protein [Pirellula sp.]
MQRASLIPAAILSLTFGAMMPSRFQGQEIGFIEKFALADDRTKALQDLIPGSHDYFYYHILHYQNTGRIAESQALLEQWSALENVPPTFQKLLARQKILGYTTNPSDVLEYLRLEMGLTLGHAPPQADQAKDLPTVLDPALHDLQRWIDHALAHDPQLGSLSSDGLLELIGRDLPIDKIRLVLHRTQRVDLAKLTAWIEKELRSADTQGWGAIPIHAQLTLSQRQELARAIPQLLENDGFVRQYLVRLLPQEHVAINDLQERRAHLQRLEDFTSTLPASQNSLKGLVLFQRLALDASEEKFDRPRFERYLALPRHQPYCNVDFLKANQNVPHVDLNAQYGGETRLPPIADDTDLIRRHLEHFLQADDNIDRFATWLDRGFLENVLIETKILYGIGNSSLWYSKLDASR